MRSAPQRQRTATTDRPPRSREVADGLSAFRGGRQGDDAVEELVGRAESQCSNDADRILVAIADNDGLAFRLAAIPTISPSKAGRRKGLAD